MKTKQALFSEFAELYCGTDDEAIQYSELLDALINDKTNDGINSLELSELLCCGCIVEVQQDKLPWGYYTIIINAKNGQWSCDSIKPII